MFVVGVLWIARVGKPQRASLGHHHRHRHDGHHDIIGRARRSRQCSSSRCPPQVRSLVARVAAARKVGLQLNDVGGRRFVAGPAAHSSKELELELE